MKPHQSIIALLNTAVACFAIGIGASALAQTNITAPSSSEQNGPQEPLVKMSAFEVTTTQGHGYVSTNAAAALKTSEQLMDIPQADIVVTNDLIQDLGYENTTDTLQYFGIAAGYEGESARMRGSSASIYIDDMPSEESYQDDAYVDSFEIIKGPTQALYLDTNPSGLILKNTKRPLPFSQYILTGQIDTNGLYRFTADLTGPLFTISGAKVSYRFVGVYQHGHTYFQNIVDNRTMLFPEVQVDYHNTTVRVYYNLHDIYGQGNGLDLMTPTGLLYTGAGRSQANQPPNNMDHTEFSNVFMEVLQKISDNWENRLRAMDAREKLGDSGTILNTGGYNWATQTEYFNHRLDNQQWNYWSVLDDTQGHYFVGPANWAMANVDAFGYAFTNWTNKSYYWVTAPFGNSTLLAGQPAGSLAVAMNNSAAINSIVVPQWYQYSPPANEGTVLETLITSIYWQHSIEIVPKWLEVIVGYTWENLHTESVSNLSTLPWTATVKSTTQYVHRVGAVLHLTKAASLYALNSTGFTPSAVGALLENGQQAPPSFGIDNEVGAKFNLFEGRLSSEFSWFNIASTNKTVTGGTIPSTGQPYLNLIGNTVQEGVDGDAAITLMPGWQLIGTFYAGHDRDQNNNPVSGSYDNAWSLFNRYDFNKNGPLHGLSVGGGVSRIGGYWVSDSGIMSPPAPLPANNEIKLHPGTLLNGFALYQFNRNWLVRVNCNNILNQTYVLAAQSAEIVDPSIPRTWLLETLYKF